MTTESLGELSLDLVLNDKGYAKALDAARKRAEALDREFVSVLKADASNFLKAFEQIERAKGRLDRIITAEFRVNTTQIQGALKIAEDARREFKKQQNTTFTADNSDFIAKAKEIRAARRNIDKPITVKIGVKIDGLFRAVNNANKAIQRLAKPTPVLLTANDRQLQKTLATAERATRRFRQPVNAVFKANAADFFKVFRNIEASKKRLRESVTVDFRSRGEERILKVLRDAQAAKRNLSGNSVVTLRAKADNFFKTFKNAQAAKKRFSESTTTQLKGNIREFQKTVRAAEKIRKSLSRDITVKILADAKQFFKITRQAQLAKQALRTDINTRLKVEAGRFLSDMAKAKKAQESLTKTTTVQLRADAQQYFRTTKRIEVEKKKFRGTATTELRANAGQFFRASTRVKEEKKELGKPVSTTLRLAKENYTQSLRQVRQENRQFSRDFSGTRLVLPGVDSGRFERSIRTAGNAGRNVLAGLFQGIGQEIFQTISTAIAGALSAPIRLGGGAIAAFSDVEAGLVNFEAKARSSVDSAEELAAVSAKVAAEAERIGIETSKTPAQVAQIATRMIELGATAAQAADNVDGVITALEATGFTDIDKTAKSFQLASNVFGETSEDFADKLALLTSSTAVTTATDVEQAFGKAGGAFKAAGQDLESLLALFSGFRSASGPEIAATATRNAVAKLLPPADRAVEIIDKLGIELFDSAGEALPILDVLEDLKARIEGLPQEERLRFLQRVFDRRSASEIALILEQLDKVRNTYDGLRQDSEGVAKQLQKDLNQGVAAAVVRLQGTIETLAGAFGRALGPGVERLIRGLTGALNTVTEAAAGGLFDPLAQSVQRLFTAIGGGSLTVDSLGAAFVNIADVIQGALAGVIDGFTNFIENNPSALQDFADGFANGFRNAVQTIGDLAGQLGEILGPVVGIAGNLLQGLADQSDVFVGALVVVGGALSPITALLKAVSDNALLVDVAFKTLIVSFATLKAVAVAGTLAGFATQLITVASSATAAATALTTTAAAGKSIAAFSALAAPVSAFTTALGGLAVAAATVTVALGVLAAAIAAGLFIKAANDARVLNDEIEALGNATNALGGAGIGAAQGLKNAIAAANEERARGLDIDQRAVQQRIRLAEEERKAVLAQRRDVEQQLAGIAPGRGFRGIRDAQREALTSQLAELRATENALDGQIGKASELLDAEQKRLTRTNELRQQDLEEFQSQEEAKQESAEKRIQAVEDAAKAASDRINQTEADAINNILQSQLSGGLDESEAATRIAEIERRATQERIAQKRAELDELAELENDGFLTVEEATKKKAELEFERTGLIRQQLEAQISAQQEAERKRREAAVAEFEKLNTAVNRLFEEQTRAQQDQLNEQAEAQKRALEDQENLLKQEFEFREQQLRKQQDAEDAALARRFDAQKKALEDQQQLERDANNQKLSAVERFVDRQIQLNNAADQEERKRLEQQFKDEDAAAKERQRLEEQALRRADSIAREDQRRRGDAVSPLEQARRDFDAGQQGQQDSLSSRQEAEQSALDAQQLQQETALAQLREESEARIAQQKEQLELQFAAQREALEKNIASQRLALENELSLQRQEAETGIQQDRAAFAAEQRRLDLQAAEQIARIIGSASPAALTARRHGGPVGPGKSYLVGEAPSVGPELGVFGNKAMLFTQPTILPSPPRGKIYSPEQTQRMTSGAGLGKLARMAGGNDPRVGQLLSEVQGLRKQLGAMNDVEPAVKALMELLADDGGADSSFRFYKAVAQMKMGGSLS